MTTIRRALTGAALLAASLGFGMAFTPDAGQAAKACWQYEAHWTYDETFNHRYLTCDGVCGGAYSECCEPCAQ